MSVCIATYNIEWFDDHFNKDNSLKLSDKSEKKLKAVKYVLKLINADR